MNHTTIEFETSKRERAMKPLFGALAIAATVATLGVLVAGPAALAPTGGDAVLAKRVSPAPIEVAIFPASIEVVARRTTATAPAEPSNFVPAVYRAR